MTQVATTKFNIPPVMVDAETKAPPTPSEFRRRPAEEIRIGDLVLVRNEAWRVKSRTTYKSSRRITFVLYPCEGGRPETRSYMPREWMPIVKAVAK